MRQFRESADARLADARLANARLIAVGIRIWKQIQQFLIHPKRKGL